MAAKFPTGSTKAESLFMEAKKDLRELEDDYKTATTGKKDSKPAGKSKAKQQQALNLPPIHQGILHAPSPNQNLTITSPVNLKRRSILIQRRYWQRRLTSWFSGSERVATVLLLPVLESARVLVSQISVVVSILCYQLDLESGNAKPRGFNCHHNHKRRSLFLELYPPPRTWPSFDCNRRV